LRKLAVAYDLIVDKMAEQLEFLTSRGGEEEFRSAFDTHIWAYNLNAIARYLRDHGYEGITQLFKSLRKKRHRECCA
jgi:hypothetical protein